MKIAVITGASSGMGREFVRQLSESTPLDEIWVIARRAERLETLKDEISVPVRPIALDLTVQKCLEQYRTLLEAEHPDVQILVNASGFGKFGYFPDMNLENMQNMIDLNVKAYVAMTHITLPYMNRGAMIYQLDSLSAFQPIPYINVYAATKAFILSFSRSLQVELRKTGIRVLAVCPGWVKTEFFDRAVSDDTITYYNRFFTAEQVVKKAIKDMKKGKDVSVCGADTRCIVFLTKHLPHRLVMKIWCHLQKKD